MLDFGTAVEREDEPHKQSKRGRLGCNREESAHLGGGAFEGVGAPEMERHQREFERQTDEDHHDRDDRRQHGGAGHREPFAADQIGQAGSQFRQVGRSHQPGQQADAIQHHAGRSGTEDDILERRFARLLASLEEGDHRVAGDAHHLDAEEEHQQVIGAGGHHHAQGGTKQQCIEVGAILVVGDSAEDRQGDHQDEEQQQAESEEERERVMHQQPGEVRAGCADAGRRQAEVLVQRSKQTAIDRSGLDVHELGERRRKRHETADQGNPAGGKPAVEADQPRQQQGDNRHADDQLGREDLQRSRQIFREQRIEDFGDAHECYSSPSAM